MQLIARLLILITFCTFSVEARTIPKGAHKYGKDLAKYSLKWVGLEVPIYAFLAQIAVESNFNPKAVSYAGAGGLTQFMKPTEREMKRKYGRLLGPGGRFNPLWAIKAMILYNRDHYNRLSKNIEFCQKWAFVFTSYNGGFGAYLGAKKKCGRAKNCNPTIWFDHLEKHAVSKENRHYARKIIYDWQKVFFPMNLGGSVICLDMGEKNEDFELNLNFIR